MLSRWFVRRHVEPTKMVDLPSQDARSVLFITLDSCRYDSFAKSDLPHLKAIGPLHQAQAPSYFTYGSHAAMFVGFTPGLADRSEPLLNPKFGKLFKLAGAGFPGKGLEPFVLQGRSIIEGFRRQGYLTLGTGAVGWFDPSTPTGQLLSRDFDDFFYPGDTWSLERQLAWLTNRITSARSPVFAFLNVGETHVPYFHHGADWRPEDNPCVPFSPHNDAIECARRQRACLEFVDRQLAALLRAFASSTILLCGDHGDCWGEDGLWEHGFHHPKVLEVPLLMRVTANRR